jgi:hypothetical protein
LFFISAKKLSNTYHLKNTKNIFLLLFIRINLSLLKMFGLNCPIDTVEQHLKIVIIKLNKKYKQNKQIWKKIQTSADPVTLWLIRR